jgi:hypothetical protein
MSVIDTPDGQYGTINPQQQIAYFASATGPETITLPPNAETILIYQNEVLSESLDLVQGVTSGCDYSFSKMPVGPPGSNPIYVVSVVPAMDSQLIIGWSGYATGISYYVVADSGIRQILDVYLQYVLGTVNFPVPTSALLMGGTDGADLRALETDSNGRLVPLVPTASVAASNTVANETYLNALGSGAYYLFGYDASAAAATDISCMANGANISQLNIAAGGNAQADLKGFRTAGPVTFTPGANTPFVALRYAIGP